MKKLITAVLLCLVSFSVLADTNGTHVGLIRWDAYCADNANTRFVQRGFNHEQYNYRALFFATKNGNSIDFNCTQATMDAEIAYAAAAGVSHWEFLHYGTDATTNPMNKAWELYQSSIHKNDVKWVTMMHFADMRASTVPTQITSMWIPWFQQPNYLLGSNSTKCPAGNCPIFQIYFDVNYQAEINGNWGGSTAAFATALGTIKTAANNAGFGDPYFVCLTEGVISAATAASLGCHAISTYGCGSESVGIANPWINMANAIKTRWVNDRAGAVANGMDYINCAGFWDTRPFRTAPAPFQDTSKPWISLLAYNVWPTGAEYTSFLQDLVQNILDFTTGNGLGNPVTNPYKLGNVYAWNECLEGGCVVPRYNSSNPAAPDTTFIDAWQAVNF